MDVNIDFTHSYLHIHINAYRLKEATNINKSLSVLGIVIMSLADMSDGKSRHIHYRDSKLTVRICVCSYVLCLICMYVMHVCGKSRHICYRESKITVRICVCSYVLCIYVHTHILIWCVCVYIYIHTHTHTHTSRNNSLPGCQEHTQTYIHNQRGIFMHTCIHTCSTGVVPPQRFPWRELQDRHHRQHLAMRQELRGDTEHTQIRTARETHQNSRYCE
jgi:hypothetical protein